MKFTIGAALAVIGLVLIWQLAGLTGQSSSGTSQPAKDMRTMR